MSGHFKDRVLGCVIAGGQSSRMGRDKASLLLDGESFLARASRLLAVVCSSVVVSGALRSPPEWPPVLPDREGGRGPLEGVVNALQFARGRGIGWVALLPVDMPLLPASLLPALMTHWQEAVRNGARACCVESDGIVQPLVSLIDVAAADVLEQRLRDGDLRVRPALEAAARRLASDQGRSPESGFVRTLVDGDDPDRLFPPGWRPTGGEWRMRSHWFINANTPEDLAIVKQVLQRSPSNTATP